MSRKILLPVVLLAVFATVAAAEVSRNDSQASREVRLRDGRTTAAVPSQASHLVTVVPCRVVDTRNPNGPYGGPKLTGGVARSFAIASGSCLGIPVTASAYSLNVTVFAPEAPGFMSLYPSGASMPLVSNLNFTTGQTLANAVIVPAGTAGAVDVLSSSNAHVIVDINGYFAEGGPTDRHPVAFAHVMPDGTLAAHSANVSGCPWNAAASQYECTIAGESYFFSDYITTVTIGGAFLFPATDSIAGKVVVIIRNAGGTQVQGEFQFVTFKP